MDVSILLHGYLFSSMDFSKLIHGFVLVVTWICQTCYMDLLKLLNGFVKLVTCFSRPLLNKTKLKFKVLKLIDWGIWYLSAMGLWVYCAFGKIYCIDSLFRRGWKIGPLVQIFRDGRQAPGSRGAHHCCCEWSFSTITEPLVGYVIVVYHQQLSSNPDKSESFPCSYSKVHTGLPARLNRGPVRQTNIPLKTFFFYFTNHSSFGKDSEPTK